MESARAINGWLVEGVVGSGKSLLLGAMQERMVALHPSRSKLVYSELYTERLLEDLRRERSLDFIRCLDHCFALANQLQVFCDWREQSKFRASGGNATVDVLIERFAGSHFANLATDGRLQSVDDHFDRVRSLYTQLARAGFSVAVLTLPSQILQEAILSTRQYRNSCWSNYLAAIGDDPTIELHFATWQEHLRTFYRSLEQVIPVQYFQMNPISGRDSYVELAESLLGSDKV